MSDHFISIREASQLLKVSERKIMELSEQGKLQSYRIAGQFVRFKRHEILNIKTAGEVTAESTHHEYTSQERVRDFFYFNDFYIIATIITAIFLYIVFYRL